MTRSRHDRTTLGCRLERALQSIESHTSRTPLGALLIGVGLAVVAMTGGIGAFLFVWIVLVELGA